MGFLRFLIFTGFFVLGSAFVPRSNSFEELQKTFPRVKDAYERKEELVLMKCRCAQLPTTFGNMCIRVFKEEDIMEIWVKNETGKYVKFNSFKIYAMSGDLGPKRMQGDNQVPEGFYYINNFNPYSNYHLSLGINYPNNSDLALSKAQHKGGDIYIHGSMVSAGCMAMSNYYIEDIYICAVKARSQGQTKIPVEIYPFKMTEENIRMHASLPKYKEFAEFWKNLAEGYSYFNKYNEPGTPTVDTKGKYHFAKVYARATAR